MTNFSEAVDYLLDNGYLAMINGEIVITGKFKREFNPVPKDKIEQIFPGSPHTISREAIWKKFIEDAKIPHKATGSNGKQYTIRQFSPSIADKLIRIIKSVDDYSALVESTKLYYQANSFKLIFSNYIDKGVMLDEYTRYKKAQSEGKLSAIITAGTGGNRFED